MHAAACRALKVRPEELPALVLSFVYFFLLLCAYYILRPVLAFGITRRVGEFAISKPTREALFTIVPREDRYKAKSFIDTVVYRGGDVLAGWTFGPLGALSLVAAGLAALWTGLAFYLELE